MIELLVVIGVIGLLAAIVLAVGASVTGSSKLRQAELVLKVLEGSSTTFAQEYGGLPPPTIEVTDPLNTTQRVLQPMVDGRATGLSASSSTEMNNSVGWYMRLVEQTPAVSGAFKGIDAKLVRQFDGNAAGVNPAWDLDQPLVATAFDPWGNPMRYVHPSLDGLIHGSNYASGLITVDGRKQAVSLDAVIGPAAAGQRYGLSMVRRNSYDAVSAMADLPMAITDSDGGVCNGAAPYFYSAGPDGRVGRVKILGTGEMIDFDADNVYVLRPQVQQLSGE